MVQSVELLLDRAGDSAVRADWERLESLGLRTPARHRSEATRPHITLAVADRVPDEVERALTALHPDFPLPLAIGGLLVFGSRRLVLTRAVAPTAALLEVQRAIAEVMATAGPTQDTLLPDRWTPHVTLARSVDPAQLARAAGTLRDRRVGIAGIGLRRWDGTARQEWLLSGEVA
jgi:2'-5' RNA ligase